MHEKVEHMKKRKKHLLIEALAGGILIFCMASAVIWLEYQDYREKLILISEIMEEGNGIDDGLQILKGGIDGLEKMAQEDYTQADNTKENNTQGTNVQEDNTEAENFQEILEKYGYDGIRNNAFGKVFQRNSILIICGECVLFLCYLSVLLFERKKEKDIREKDSIMLAHLLEQLRGGKYGLSDYGILPGVENYKVRILDQIEALSGYLRIITEQSSREREEVKVLVTDISHQLKTPVAALKSCFEVLKSGTLTKEENLEFQHRMEQQLKGLEQLMDSLVNISRMEAGMINLQTSKSRIFDTILEAVNRVWMKAEEKKIEIQMEADEKIEKLEVRHDKKWLCEALINVLENAIKYSPKDTEITIRAKKWGLFLRIEIEDQGIGIAKSEYHKIFQRFYRGEHEIVRKSEGSGVGLYLARKIVEGHHGTIFVSGKNGTKSSGSIFVIQIPF